jgi:hypothetical protein
MAAEIYAPELKTDLCELLDIAIDETVLREKFSTALFVDPKTGQPIPELVAEEDDTLLELVFLCDARAQAENDDYAVVNAISWVDFAKQGIRRVGQHTPSKQGLEKARLLSDADMAIQAEAYEDMAERRIIVKGPSKSDYTGLEYALRVAQGEIVLSSNQNT